jgi:hypothetical protein
MRVSELLYISPDSTQEAYTNPTCYDSELSHIEPIVSEIDTFWKQGS